MSLLFSTQIEAQKAIVDTVLKVKNTHSMKSFMALMRRFDYLNNYGDNIDIVITHATTTNGQIEFGLKWVQKKKKYYDIHPIAEEGFMFGGLVYHSHDESWGVHT